MSWSVNFQIKDGKIDPETAVYSGDVPDTTVMVNGHENDVQRSLGVNAGGLSAYATENKVT